MHALRFLPRSVVLGAALSGCAPSSPVAGDPPPVRWEVAGLDASFEGTGVQLAPNAGPAWEWELVAIGGEPVSAERIARSGDLGSAVSFERGSIVERYVRGSRSIEQQFVIEAPLPLDDDLVIDGRIATDGTFHDQGTRWTWRNDEGAVAMGDVTVFDANGRELDAWLEVSADRTSLRVDA
ncbi:MAG: hypothetical protein R3F61_22600, partial [Myxococcota bacterium]